MITPNNTGGACLPSTPADRYWFILERNPGGVLSSFDGSREQAYAECDSRNAADDSGSTRIISSFLFEDVRNGALDILINGVVPNTANPPPP